MRQLNLPPIIWNVSHLKIFPLELLGPAIGFLAGPRSCKGKISRWDTTTNSSTTNKCPILDVLQTNRSQCNGASFYPKYITIWNYRVYSIVHILCIWSMKICYLDVSDKIQAKLCKMWIKATLQEAASKLRFMH